MIGGRNIKEYDPSELREQLGIIFQDFVRYQMTASENIGMGRVAEIENRDLIGNPRPPARLQNSFTFSSPAVIVPIQAFASQRAEIPREWAT